MALFDNFPWTNIHELNLDWIIKQLKENKIDAENINTELANLKQYVADTLADVDIIPKKYLLVGDSYATGYQGDGTYVTGFFQRIINYTGIDATIVAQNGYGFLGMGNNHTWFDLIVNSNIQNPETYTDIIILGGMNDPNNETLVVNAMSNLMTYLKTTFTNAKIHVGEIGRYKHAGGADMMRIQSVTGFYIQYATSLGYTYVAHSENILQRSSYFNSDNIHPNDWGQEELAKYIGQYIRGGVIDIVRTPARMTLSNPNNYTVSNLEIYTSQVNDMAYFGLRGKINFDPTIAINNNDQIDLGTIDNCYVKANTYGGGLSMVVPCYTYTNTLYNGSHFVGNTVVVYIRDDGHLVIKFTRVQDNGNIQNLADATEISFILGAFSTYLPCIMC